MLRVVTVHIGPSRPGRPETPSGAALLGLAVTGKAVPFWGVEWSDSLAPHWLPSPAENRVYLLPR